MDAEEIHHILVQRFGDAIASASSRRTGCSTSRRS